VQAGRIAVRCRRAASRILGLGDDPSRIVFSLNATHGLNLALHGILRSGDLVVTTAYDHNAVLRPIHRLKRERGLLHRQVAGARDGTVDLAAVEAAVDGARLLVINAASNVLGTTLPMAEMADLAHEAGALVLVDAAQWAGHFVGGIPRADVVAFTGHKGLLGPQGIGGLWIAEGLRLPVFYAGGTGSDSLDPEMPESSPDRFEAGSLNSPGMAGLLAGIEFLESEGVQRIHTRELELKAMLREGLEGIRGVTVLSPPAPEGLGVVTIRHDRIAPSELALRLDREWGVLVRHGLNCAPEVHKLLGTTEGGAVRFSLGWASTRRDVEQAIRGVDVITSRLMVPGS
jgi:selenocysteine lyase/cysteine desulfurase